MNRKKFLSKICIAILISFASTGLVFAVGLDDSTIGLKGQAMGNAFVGIADDASAIYYNPGGMSFLDKDSWNILIYANSLLTNLSYTDTGGTEYISRKKPFTGGLFITKTFTDLAVGLGIYMPYGSSGVAYEDYPESGDNYEYWMGTIAITPSVSYKILSNLSVGGGVSMYYGIMMCDLMLEYNSFPLRVQQNTWSIAGFGFNLGTMFKPMQELSVGFEVKGMIRRLKNDYNFNVNGTVELGAFGEYNTEVKFTLPWYFSLGVGYKPFEKLTLGISVVYMMWHVMEEMTFSIQGFAISEIEWPMDYRDSFTIGLGAEYIIIHGLALRGGLKFSLGASKDEGLKEESCDVSVLVPSIGVGYSIIESIEIGFTGLYVIGFEREFESQKYDQDKVILELGAKLKF